MSPVLAQKKYLFNLGGDSLTIFRISFKFIKELLKPEDKIMCALLDVHSLPIKFVQLSFNKVQIQTFDKFKNHLMNSKHEYSLSF